MKSLIFGSFDLRKSKLNKKQYLCPQLPIMYYYQKSVIFNL